MNPPDLAYANADFIPNATQFPSLWARLAQEFRAGAKNLRKDLAYGPGLRQTLDLVLPDDVPRGWLFSCMADTGAPLGTPPGRTWLQDPPSRRAGRWRCRPTLWPPLRRGFRDHERGCQGHRPGCGGAGRGPPHRSVRPFSGRASGGTDELHGCGTGLCGPDSAHRADFAVKRPAPIASDGNERGPAS